VAFQAPEARHCGDGEWFCDCAADGCTVYRMGFTKTGAEALMTDHLNRVHKAGLPSPPTWVDQ